MFLIYTYTYGYIKIGILYHLNQYIVNKIVQVVQYNDLILPDLLIWKILILIYELICVLTG